MMLGTNDWKMEEEVFEEDFEKKAVGSWRGSAVVCSVLAMLFLLFCPLNSALGKRTLETAEVLERSMRLSDSGPMYTLYVGQRLPDPRYLGGRLTVMAQVKVDNLSQYPIGSQVTYSIWRPWLIQFYDACGVVVAPDPVARRQP